MNDLQQKLLEKIKAGEVTMVPRWHFLLRGLLWATALVTVALVAIYLLSFIFFMLRHSGLMFAPLFGWHGLMIFVVSSPWILVGMLGLFLCALYLLVTHYSFSYQKPLVYSMIGVVLFVIAVASLIQQTSMHERIRTFATEREVPGLAPLYRDATERKSDEVTRGEIRQLSESGFMLKTVENEVYPVIVSGHTKLPFNHALEVDDAVMVFGPLREGSIDAFGVRLDDGQLPPFRRTGGRE